MTKTLNFLKTHLAFIILVLVIVGLLILYAITLKEKNDLMISNSKNNSNSSSDQIIDLNLTKVELAKTEPDQENGLMDRKSLCDSCGMLFIFDKNQELTFWMKNTFIPLDIIFMDENGRITNIAKNATPLNQIERYHSNGLAKYALEVNAGYSDKNNLKNGDKINVIKIKSYGIPYQSSSSSQVQLYI